MQQTVTKRWLGRLPGKSRADSINGA